MKNAEKRRPGYGVVVPIGRSQARQARFGPFILDFGRRTLVRDDERLHLTPKPFETLAFLLENSGRTVSKQELLDAVWGNAAVTEDTLVKAVREVRRVLGDDRDEPTFVQTVPREGYRFVAPVSFDRTDSETAAPPAPARPRRTWVLAIGLLTASGALVATLSHWGAVEDLPRSPRQRVLLAGLPGEQRSASFSPDGNFITFVHHDEGAVPQILVANLSGGEPIQLTRGDVPAHGPSWSPRNDVILFGRGTGRRRDLWTVPPLGGGPRRFLDNARHADWSWDGERVVFERGDEIWVADADGANARPVKGVPTVELLLAPRMPALSPDGTLIAFFQCDRGPVGDIWVVPTEGGEARRLTHDIQLGGAPAWTPDGAAVVYASRRGGSLTLWKAPIDGNEPEPVLVSAGEDLEPDISPDGSKLVYTHTRSRYALTLVDPDSGDAREIFETRHMIVDPSFSPSGERIAFFGFNDEGAVHVFVMDADGGPPRELTFRERNWNIHPRWGRDDRDLFYYQHHPSFTLRRADVSTMDVEVVAEDWSWGTRYDSDVDPSGRFLAVTVRAPGQPPAGVVLDIEIGEELLSVPRVGNLEWSPAGDALAVADQRQWSRGAEGEVSICAPDFRSCRVLSRGYNPRWRRDGQAIFFLRYGDLGHGREVWTVALDGTGERKVMDLYPIEPAGQFYDVSPDGEVLFVRFEKERDELWLAEADGLFD